MRKDSLRKFYDRLTPEERFRLYIEPSLAVTRRNGETSRRVVRESSTR